MSFPKTVYSFWLSILACGCALSHPPGSAMDASVSSDASTADVEVDEEVLASSTRLLITDVGLYWADYLRGAIMSRARGGGGIEVLSNAASPSMNIAVTAGELVWVDRGLSIKAVALTGGRARTIGQGSGGPIGVAARGDSAYYLRLLSPDREVVPLLVEVDLVTGIERTFTDFQSGLALVLDGDDLIGAGCGRGIERLSRGSGLVRRLDADSFCPTSVVLNGTELYFGDTTNPERPDSGAGVFRMPLGGGNPERVADLTGFAFAVHRESIYVQQEGELVRVPSAGGPAGTLARAPGDVLGIAVDDEFVYWIADEGGEELALRQSPLPR